MPYQLTTELHPANFVGAPVAYSYPGSSLFHVFYRGADNRLYYNLKSPDSKFHSNWELDTVGLLNSEPAVCATGPNDLHVFVQGTDGQLWHKWRVKFGPWSAWEPLGGKFKGKPAAISRNMVVIDIFVRGTDDNLYQKRWDGGKWLDWIRINNTQSLASSPTVCSTGPRGLNLFWRTVDGQLWHMPWTGETGWHRGEALGGQIIVDPVAISYGIIDKIVPIDVFAVGTDGMIYRREWTGREWRTWKYGLEPWLSGKPEARQNVYGGIAALPWYNIPRFFIGQKNQIIKELKISSVSTSQQTPTGPAPNQPAPTTQQYAFCVSSGAGRQTEYVEATSAEEADRIMAAIIKDLNSGSSGGTFAYTVGACL